jgi:predicted ribosomally synthesized peptide with nif11-like leader
MTQVQAFLKKMEEDKFRTAFEGAATPEAKKGILAKAGLDISVEAALEALAGELGDEDLEAVAGGGAGVIRYPPGS